MLDKRKKVYIGLVILILVVLYTLKNTNWFVRVTTFIISLMFFHLADKFFEFKFERKHYIGITIIAISGILLSQLYFISPNYDKLLHLVSPFLVSAMVFHILGRTKLKLSTKLFLTFSIVIMILSVFEIIEFSLDKLFDMKLQGVFLRDISGIEKLNIIMDRNDDTMIDLILGSIGAITFSAYTFIRNKLKKSSAIIKN